MQSPYFSRSIFTKCPCDMCNENYEEVETPREEEKIEPNIKPNLVLRDKLKISGIKLIDQAWRLE